VLDAAVLHRLLRGGSTVAFGDGAGVPAASAPALSAPAAEVGDVELLLGWFPGPFPYLDVSAFRSVRAFMGGYGHRRPIDEGGVAYVPARLGAVPALLQGPLRPDVLVASMRRGSEGGWCFTTEVSWQRAAVDAGAMVAALERPASPCADAGPPVPEDRVVVLGQSPDPPAEIDWAEPSDTDRVIAERLVPLLPDGVRLQVAPGPIGEAVLEALRRPVVLDTGVLTDAAVDLAERGLLAEDPVAPYLAGTSRLYRWADGRAILYGLEHTHDPVRLSAGRPFVAVQTALQVDVHGQPNVESVGGSALAGIGGQPDYAYAATRSAAGLSVLAVPTTRRGHPTLVEELDGAASTPSHDVDVVVTEFGVADLRGLDRASRRRAIAQLWRQ
jgi:acyl-CoA hydrolase